MSYLYLLIAPVVLFTMFGVGVHLVVKANRQRRVYTATATGRVIKILRVRRDDASSTSRLTLKPLCEFTANDGVTRTVTPLVSKTNCSYLIGDEILVHYNPSNPDESTILTKDTLNLGIFFIAMSVAISIVMIPVITIILTWSILQ